MKNINYVLLISFSLFISCNSSEFTTDEIMSYSKKIGIPKEHIFFIHEDFQKEIQDKGQPYINIYNNEYKGLKIGTCYEELPFLIDTLLHQKKQVIDTMSFYEKNPIAIEAKMKQFSSVGNNKISIDTSKRYFIFYHYAKYAEELDKKKIPPMYERYKDSVQFFFINVDKIKQ